MHIGGSVKVFTDRLNLNGLVHRFQIYRLTDHITQSRNAYMLLLENQSVRNFVFNQFDVQVIVARGTPISEEVLQDHGVGFDVARWVQYPKHQVPTVARADKERSLVVVQNGLSRE